MQNFYGVYLTSDGTTIRFPVNPREYSIEYPASNERYNVLSLGEIVQPRTPGLRKISWDEGLLPGRPDGPYVLTSGAFEPPEFYIEFLRSCQADKKVCTLTIDRRYEDGTPYQSDSFPVIVEGFTVTERGAETGDFYYSITLTEHREYAPGAVTLLRSPGGAATAVTQQQRNVPKNQLVVGSRVKVNGAYCYDSYGAKPHGAGNGRTAVVGRLLESPGRAYPILLKTESGGLLGWCAKDAVTVQ